VKERLLSLDAFRGFDIAAMLFVNMTWNQKVFHPQLFHIDYNAPAQGATFTDLVFPWFLFIAGCAIPLSMRSGRGRAMSAGRKVAVAARRGLVIYLLGVLLTVAGSAYDSPVRWTHLFSWNILQLIGAGYFVAVCVYLLPRWAQVSFVVAVLVAKAATMALIPAEWVRDVMQAAGLSPRVLTAAGAEALVGPGTFTHFDDIKRLVHLEHLKAGHDGPLVGKVALFVGGWLGMAWQWLPCAAIAVLGGLSMEILTDERRGRLARAGRLLAFGAALTALAYLLQAGYRPEGGGWLGLWTQPFSKWLFTPSYCLLSAGTGALLLGGFFLVVDCWKWTSLTWLRIYGMNAIALYLAAELSFKIIFAKWQIVHPNGHSGAMAGGFIAWVEHWARGLGASDWWAQAWGGWVFVIVWLAGWWIFCWQLWRKKIFLRV
jgi:predicted acyltransferase